MNVTTSRDETGKRIRLRTYRCQPQTRQWFKPGEMYGSRNKYTPHQGKREKARRLARTEPLPMAVE